MIPVCKGYLQLTRPANLPTAAADILAGIAITGWVTTASGEALWPQITPILLLVAASVLLYAAGVVLNDVFDFRLDQTERPERPIPSGVVPLRSAIWFGALLAVAGVACAFGVGPVSGGIALSLSAAILLYNAVGKHHSFWGPLNMGLCRGLNLLLGMSLLGYPHAWGIALIPIIYIGAITFISRGEVHGNNRSHIVTAAILYGLVLVGLLGLPLYAGQGIWQALPFILLFALMVLGPLKRAYHQNSPQNIKKAVKAGVISIIILDAALAVGFSSWWVGMAILLLLPLSIFLSRLFAVT